MDRILSHTSYCLFNRDTVAYIGDYPTHSIEFFVNQHNKTEYDSYLFLENE